MAGIGLGLRFNLADWKRGVGKASDIVKKNLGDSAFGPFKKAGAKASLSLIGMFKTSFGGIGAIVKGGLGPLLAIGATVGGILAVKNALSSSMEAADAYGDSIIRLRAGLSTMGDGINVDAATKNVEALGKKLQLAMGINRAETNDVFSNFVTRGFDLNQARQLTILAANYARKSGKPLAEVAQQIGSAANGNVNAIKSLGVQVATTGNKVIDARNAVLALKAAYGEVGADLTDPTDRLSAAINDLQIGLGERLLPLFEPLITYVADFVNGLLKSEEGRAILDGIAGALGTGIDFVQGMIVGVSNLVEVVKNGGAFIVAKIKEYIASAMAYWLEQVAGLPGSDWLLEKLGIDRDALTKSLSETAASAAKASGEAISKLAPATDALMNGEARGGVAGGINSIAQKGREIREQATSELSGEISATKSEGFAGKIATEAEREKAKQKLQAKAKASGWDSDGSLTVSVTARGGQEYDMFEQGSEIDDG